ncbi:MAG: ABC transporter ATP-binding protein [bacterium]|nr:ABC transporter ATP-binding protein [bacterium]
MKKISSYIWEYKWAYIGAIISMIIAVSLDMLAPQLTRLIIDRVVLGGETTLLPKLLIGILTVGVGRCIFQYIKEYTFDTTAAKIATKIRRNLFQHIQSLSMDFFDRNNTGELMARVKDDVDKIWNALGFIGMLIIEVCIHTGIVLFCMYRTNVKLAIIPTIAMPLVGAFAIIMEFKLGSIYGDISEENAVLNTVAEENLAGVRTVKAFAREKHEITKFLSHNQRYYDLNMKQSKVFVKYFPLFQFVTRLLPISVLILGGLLVINKEMTLGELGAFTEYSMNIVWPMEMLGWLTNEFSSARASNKKFKKIYAETPSIREPEHPVTLEHVKGEITFEHVSFHKADQHDILKDIEFHVEPGKTIGIMGATGAGKSSIVSLLQRLYDATDGNILLDGVNIRDLSLRELRKNISIVMQDVFLFSDTISDNIKFGKRDLIDFKTIRSAASDAQAVDFIEQMEQQYDTVIGERGVGLSGGQKQRISIARAIAKKAPILVLDDSTSALDMETEHEIQLALNELKDTTKIIIAHRISAVRNADEIIILKDGEIAERGTHESLLAKEGLYHLTYMAQYGDYLETITA